MRGWIAGERLLGGVAGKLSCDRGQYQAAKWQIPARSFGTASRIHHTPIVQCFDSL